MIKKICLLILLCVTFLINAQEPVFVHFSEKNGLPDKEFYDLIEDSKGFVWLAADKGLFRYDGKAYKKYTNELQRSSSIFNLQEDKFKGALLSIVFVSDGTINRVRIWGNDFTDKDLEASVENFYRQFDKKRKALPLNNVLSETNAKKHINSLTELERYPYTHAKTMLNNNHLIRKTWGFTRRGQAPNVSFFEDKRDGFLYLLQNVDKLNYWSSKEYIPDYKKAANSTIEGLNNVIDYMNSNKETSSSKIRSMVVSSKSRKNLCSACHSTPSVSNNKIDIYKQIRKDFINKGMRQDLYQLGFDIWGIPKKSKESQSLAHLVKAGAIVFQILNKQ